MRFTLNSFSSDWDIGWLQATVDGEPKTFEVRFHSSQGIEGIDYDDELTHIVFRSPLDMRPLVDILVRLFKGEEQELPIEIECREGQRTNLI